jgi:cystathionine beta-lyase/cystathionine gamma-synthase
MNTGVNMDEPKEPIPGFETQAIHAGQDPDPLTGSVVPPIYQTSTYKQDGVGGLRGGYEYSRTANPTRTALEECLAALEGGSRALAFASGMAAEDCLLRAVCRPGDRVIIPDDAYGGTYRLFSAVLEQWGIEYAPVHLPDIAAVRRSLAERPTRVLWAETPTNPLLAIADIAGLAEAAHEAGALLVVDNTFASPRLQRPLTLGADVVVHSTTKYIGGHSDVVGGRAGDLGHQDRRRRGLPAQRHRRCAQPVRLLADAARDPHAGRPDGQARRERDAGGADAVQPPGGDRGHVPRAAYAPGPQHRGQADERVRRHGVVPRAGR